MAIPLGSIFEASFYLIGASSKENKNESKDKEESLHEQKFTVDDLLKKVQNFDLCIL
jgi:hypothetical protein